MYFRNAWNVKTDSCKFGVGAFILLALMGATSRASISSWTGDIFPIAAPASVNDGALESNTHIFAFSEQQNITLSSAVPVDVSVPGSVPSSPTNNNLSPSQIPIGTTISSYYLHCDVVGTPGVPLELTGSITFTTDILGVIVQQDTLNATKTYPGLPSTVYSSISGLELNTSAGPDSIVLSADRRTVSVDFLTGTSVDDIRIITASPVPEPASLAMLGVGAIACLLRRKRS